jgi:hypothetical protein
MAKVSLQKPEMVLANLQMRAMGVVDLLKLLEAQGVQRMQAVADQAVGLQHWLLLGLLHRL